MYVHAIGKAKFRFRYNIGEKMLWKSPNQSSTAFYRYQIFSKTYSVLCKVNTGYCGTCEIKLGDYLSVQAHKPCSISHILHVDVSKIGQRYKNNLAKRVLVCENKETKEPLKFRPVFKTSVFLLLFMSTLFMWCSAVAVTN